MPRLTRRRQLVEMLTAERNRLLVARATIRRDLQQHIRFLERRLREADDDLHTAIKASALWRVKDDLLQSVPESAAWSRSLCSPNCRNSAASVTRRSPRSSASPRSTATAARCEANAWCTAAERRCGGPLHGRPGRHEVQPGDPRLLPAPAGRGQADQGVAHRLHAEAAHDPQRHRPRWPTLAASRALVSS